jgi:hypothetical protein
MERHRMRIAAVAVLAGSGLLIAGGWETSALGDVSAYTNSPEVGMNIAGLSVASTQWTLSNYYLSSGGWAQLGTQDPSFDSSGDPILANSNENEGQYIYWQGFGSPTPDNNRTGDYPAGQYTITWTGSGGLNLSGDTSQDYQWNSSGDTTTTETFNVTPGNSGLYLIDQYSGNSASDPITNIHVYAPGYAPGQANAGQIFTTPFKQGLHPFGTTRFMDAMNTNGNTQAWTSLSQGPQLSDETWTGPGGMPVAAMVTLANQTNTNPWFCMPANASNAYVTQFAQYVKANLDSNLKVYVEYANEDWSSNNPSGQHIAGQSGGAVNGPTFDSNWASDVSAVFNDWESVYGGSSSSLVRVAAFQTSNRYDTPMFLTDLKADGGFDAIADAPYFSSDTSSYGSGTTATQILNDLIANIKANAVTTPNGQLLLPGSSTIQATGDWAWNKQLATYFNVPLIGYEGGQGLAPESTSVPWYNAYVQAEESPEMEQVYELWLQTYLNQVGGSEVNAYNYVGNITQYGAWGSMEYQGQNGAPKYDGMLDYLTGVPEPATCAMTLPALGLLLSRRRSTRS